MRLLNYVDPKRCWQLISGVLGIYVSYLVTGIYHEKMLKMKYKNDFTGRQQAFIWPAGFLIFPCLITSIIGELVNKCRIEPKDVTYIPARKSICCALIVTISTLTYTYAIYITNYPVVMMFKSCNLISVILVGVLCSRVKDKKLKLATKKIIIGVVITIGIIIFKAFDPQPSNNTQKKTQWLGIVLLIVSLLADGFLPDFQAAIKSEHSPRPMQMMTQINIWVAIISIIYSFSMKQMLPMFDFLVEHRLFSYHLFLMGILGTIGQMFVYRMIKQFKQHFAPFVITTRKIFTVCLSIFYFHHPTNAWQILGILLVFGLVTYQFVSELAQEKVEDSVTSPQSTVIINSQDMSLEIHGKIEEEQVENQQQYEKAQNQQQDYNQKRGNASDDK